jgi:hypothetical protein
VNLNPPSSSRITTLSSRQLPGRCFAACACLIVFQIAVCRAAIRYVDAGGTNPVQPYVGWSTAATNIQDAINAAVAGDLILVTNGTYSYGGKVKEGNLSNRVALDKALTVQSVNGPLVTVIQGAWDPATNGPTAIRCAWVANNAVLSGFTLRSGATRAIGFPTDNSMFGGGVWGSSSAGIVSNCVITSCFAGNGGGGASTVSLRNCVIAGCHAVGGSGSVGAGSGGGAISCDLRNCILTNNFAEQSDGGATASCVLRNCYLANNSAPMNGAAARGGSMVNCTVVSNVASGNLSTYGAAVYGASVTNCIIWANSQRSSYPSTNYASCVLAWCCAAPVSAGPGNFSSDPLLLADGAHLDGTSPCRAVGNSAVTSVTDLDGQPWNSPPSIGCDEWRQEPVAGLQPGIRPSVPAHGLTLSVVTAGQGPFGYTWSKDGVAPLPGPHFSDSGTGTLVVHDLGPDDAGTYQVVISNSFGVATSQVAQIVIHAVDTGSSNALLPFFSWATAATTIQDAINAASPGDIVLVTNGVYSTGGKVISGSFTNRVVLDKPLVVMSVNGFSNTIIEGAWDPAATNGTLAVRCAWLTNGALLNGFTLRNGATQARSGSIGAPLETGGGAWCAGSNAVVACCVMTNNRAIYGGGMGSGTLNNCFLIANTANEAGGGAYLANVNNCTIVQNSTVALFAGAGVYDCVTRNTIISDNYYGFPYIQGYDNYRANALIGTSYMLYCCTDPLKSGSGNIDVGSLFVDLYHISTFSPCRGAGSALYASGSDAEGEPWGNPPSIGWDEPAPANLIGPIILDLRAWQTDVFVGHYAYFTGFTTGHVSQVSWSFGDGLVNTNADFRAHHPWAAPGDYVLSFTAYNTDFPAGVSTNMNVHVILPDAPQLTLPSKSTTNLLFQFPAQASISYTVQYATNLAPPITWKTLQSIFASTGGVYQVKDPGPTNTARFYRLMAQ